VYYKSGKIHLTDYIVAHTLEDALAIAESRAKKNNWELKRIEVVGLIEGGM